MGTLNFLAFSATRKATANCVLIRHTTIIMFKPDLFKVNIRVNTLNC